MARVRTTPLPSPDTLRSLYTYDPQTGEFRHRHRDGAARGDRSFNTRFAGKIAGCVMNVGYWFVSADGQSLLAHRVAWAIHYGAWPDGEIDHRDGDKLNNSIDNLREVTRAQNCRNRPGWAASGLKGAWRCPYSNRWYSSILYHGRKIRLGRFDTAEQAHAAYVSGARKYHGEFANTTVIALGSIAATITFEASAV